MKTIAKNVLAFSAALLLSGCASSGPKLVSTNAIRAAADYTVYTGSDDQYHYFTRKQGLRDAEMKVAKAQLKLRREFPRGTNAKFIEKSADGKIEVIFLDEQDAAPGRSETTTTKSATVLRR